MVIETTGVYGFKSALIGMRNPMNSWDSRDSLFWKGELIDIGQKDLKLAQNLIKAGNEHSKFLRMIQVWIDVVAPLYIWSEWDTYKFNTKNSCSTMHKLLNTEKPISLEMFHYDKKESYLMETIVKQLELFRIQYLRSKHDSLIERAKAILPSGYLQFRTVNTNYAELRNMYFQRRNHRLPEWNDTFCKWIETLPYSKELIMFEE